MKLAVKERVGEKKKDIKEIRREGNIPAIHLFFERPTGKIDCQWSRI